MRYICSEIAASMKACDKLVMRDDRVNVSIYSSLNACNTKKNYKLMQGGSRLVIHTERKPCAWGKVLPVDEFTSTDRELWSLFSQ